MKTHLTESQSYAVTRNTESMKNLIELSKKDPELAHGKAEDLLLDTLKVLGITEIVDAFNSIKEQ